MPTEMKGRRLPLLNYGTKPEPFVGDVNWPTEPGDYCGPVKGNTRDALAVYYLLPVARDPGTAKDGRRVHHMCIPPHRFIEEPDGSLTIRESIGAEPHWHGFLTEGRWELTKSKP
jgi:hypothetical protein